MSENKTERKNTGGGKGTGKKAPPEIDPNFDHEVKMTESKIFILRLMNLRRDFYGEGNF